MEKMFCLGLMFGALGGALVVANSYKVRSLVKKSQSEFIEKVNEAVDQRLNAMQSGEQSQDGQCCQSDKKAKN